MLKGLNTLTFLSEDQLNKMTTKRLLTYYKKHRLEVYYNKEQEVQDHFALVKEILNTREHVE